MDENLQAFSNGQHPRPWCIPFRALSRASHRTRLVAGLALCGHSHGQVAAHRSDMPRRGESESVPKAEGGREGNPSHFYLKL